MITHIRKYKVFSKVILTSRAGAVRLRGAAMEIARRDALPKRQRYAAQARVI